MSSEDVYTKVAGLTDVGMVRTNNEDTFLISDFRSGEIFDCLAQQKRSLDDNSMLLIVSDGVGGAAVGEIASNLTVHSINEALSRLSWEIAAYDRLVAAIEQANYIVWHESRNNAAYQGMSATATAVLIERDRAYIDRKSVV